MEIGLWVWYAEDAQGPDGKLMDQLDWLREHGVSRLYVKSGDGASAWLQFVRCIDRLKECGFEVWSWQYVYGNDPDAEANAALMARGWGSDGHVLDPEAEFRDIEGNVGRAESLCATIRERAPTWPLWYSSFAFPRFHAAFPWTQFHALCDGAMPQLFPAYGGPWDRADLAAAILAEYEQFGLDPGKVSPLWEMFTAAGDPLPGDSWRGAIEQAETRSQRFDVFRWGLVGTGGWGALREIGVQSSKFKVQSSEYSDLETRNFELETLNSALVTRLGYLQGDVAQAIEGPLLELQRRLRGERSLRLLQAALAALKTLKTEGKD